MKSKYTLLILLSLLFISCGEDRRKEYLDWTEPNEWIEEVMRDVYYWNEQIKESKDLNYYAAPNNFFETLLNSADSKNGFRVSKIIDTREEELEILGVYKKTYGFYYDQNTFSPKNSTTRTQYALRVTYVIEDTPADRAGLKRGDWIVQLSNNSLNQANIKNTFTNCDSILNITLGEYDSEGDSITVTDKKLTVDVGEPVIEKPVQLSKVITTSDSKQVGYLLYNHFSTSLVEGNQEYLDDLVQVSKQFEAAGISELILDFRFNPGGTLPASELLSNMIIPQDKFGEIMYQVEYNNANSHDDYIVNFNRNGLRGASNLNLNRVYFITSRTTASAAELVINSLKPHIDVVTIGLTTLGEDVGIKEITDDQNRYPWIIYPVVCKFLNSDDNDFPSGISPSYMVSEKDSTIMKQLGDPEELLLKRALDNIEGNDIIEEEDDEEEEPDTRSSNNKKVSHPLLRKKIPGILIK